MQNFVAIQQEVYPRYPRWNIGAPEKVNQNSQKFSGMLLTKGLNQPKFCRTRLKNVGDICDKKFVKWAKIDQDRLRPATP